MNGTGICRADECRAQLLWRKNVATGRRIPLDAAPVESDARFVSAAKHHYVLLDGETCRPVTAAEWADHKRPVYISHFRTCLKADLWSGRRDG